MSRNLFALAAAFRLSVTPPPAFAHAHLHASDPAAGSTVAASPEALRLTFSEPLELKGCALTLAGPDGADSPLGALALDPADGEILVAKPAAPLKPGAHKVNWKALAKDMHRTEGGFSFTVRP